MRKKILKSFNEYCRKCNGMCCMKEAEFTVFKEELKNLPVKKSELNIRKQWGNKGKSSDINIERIGMKGKCIFVGDKGCKINIDSRPVDCISYPIYPIIKYSRDEDKDKDIIGMMVHRSCPFCKEISKDRKLISLMLKFWEKELFNISKKDIRDWFGNKRNYWLDKNIIRIKIKI